MGLFDLWVKDNWDQGKGRSVAIKIKKKIKSYRSDFQKIEIFDTECFGRMMMLDGVIMLTEFDEYSYHEMISHVALNVHPKPKKVLIIGGGDGGTAREVLKHQVDEVHLCEIDEEVVNVSKEFFPSVSSSFSNPKLKVFFDDGAKFINERKNYYDIIIVDSSDPIGPAEVLFKEKFYKDMYNALTRDGIVVTQSESMFYDKDLISNLFKFNKNIYKVLRYYYTIVPTYPSGTIGFSFCSKKYDPVKDFCDKKIKGLKYYNSDIHKSAFILPNFMNDISNKKTEK